MYSITYTICYFKKLEIFEYHYYFFYDKKNEDIVSQIRNGCKKWGLKISVPDEQLIAGSGTFNATGRAVRSCERMVFFLTKELLDSDMSQLRMQANPHIQDLLLLHSGMAIKFINVDSCMF